MEHLLSSIYLLCQYLENKIILDMELPPATTLFRSEAELGHLDKTSFWEEQNSMHLATELAISSWLQGNISECSISPQNKEKAILNRTLSF